MEGGSGVSVERRDLKIGEAVLKRDRDADVALNPGDVLTVHQLAGWNDIGASISIEGEVAHPGSYEFKQGERLSDVLKRAMDRKRAGDTIELTVYRNGSAQKINVKLSEAPDR